MSQVQSWNLILLWPFRLQTKRPQNTVEAILNQTFEEGKSPWVELDDTLIRKEAVKPHIQPAREPRESDPEYTYFHPFVRRLLYDNKRPTFRLLRRRTEGFRYCWVTAGDETTIARLEVRDILLYVASQQAFNAGSVAILKIELNSTEPMPFETFLDTSEYIRYITRPKEEPPNMVRVSFGDSPVSAPPLPGEPRPAPMDPRTLFFHEHWGRLIHPIVGPGEPVGPNQVGVELLGDIRMAVMSAVSMHDPFSLSTNDWARIAAVDSHTFPSYAEPFIENELAGCFYDRWWDRKNDKTHRYVFGPMLFASVSRHDRGFEKWRWLYFQLFFIAHFQRAMLLVLQDEIATLALSAEPENAAFRSQIEQLDRSAAVFESAYWFKEVTPQIQGQQIFESIRKQLTLDELHGSVMGEKLMLSTWTATLAERRREDFRSLLEKFIPLGLVAGILGINVWIEPLKAWFGACGQEMNNSNCWPWTWCKVCGSLLSEFWIVLAAVLLVYGPYLYMKHKSKKKEK